MKKIFLWGNYDIFSCGIRVYKQKGDFLLITVEVKENFRHQMQSLLYGVKYITNKDGILSFQTMEKYFKKEKPDYLAIVTGHESVDTIQEFNKTKIFCEENNAHLMIVKTCLEKGFVNVLPGGIYDSINQLETVH